MSASPPGPLLVDVDGTVLTADDRDLLKDAAVGGVILFSRNFAHRAQLAELTADIRAIRHDLLIVADYEGGRVQRFTDGFTRIPPMARLGARYDEDRVAAMEVARTIGWLVAVELSEVGIDMPLAPVLDRDYARSNVIGSRALATSPAAIAELGAAYAGGLTAGGSAATAKHFPGHGWVEVDSHAGLPIDTRGEAALVADWGPFEALIAAGIDSVMMAHIHYPAVDDRPASLSAIWIGEILRGRLGFKGCVFCDDLSMGGAAATGDYATRTRAALMAGCDYLPVCSDRAAARIACEAIGDTTGTGLANRESLHNRLVQYRARLAPADPPDKVRARRLIASL